MSKPHRRTSLAFATLFIMFAGCGGAAENGATNDDAQNTATRLPASTQDSPDAWARRMAAAHDTREVLPKMSARDTKLTTEVMDILDKPMRPVIKADGGSGYALEVYTVVRRFDALWKTDRELNSEFLSRATSRIAALTGETVATWRAALLQAQKSDVSDVWTVVLLARTDRVFGPAGLDQQKATLVLSRLASVPDSTAGELSELLKTGRADAALRVAESDVFFDPQNQLRPAELARGVNALRAARASGQQ